MKTKVSFNSLLYSCILIFFQAQVILAQWSGDPLVNNCVTDAPKDQKSSCIVSDGLGNFIIGWRDLQFASNVLLGGVIYTQKFNADGIIQWAENGIRVNGSTGDAHADNPALIKCEDGKVIAVWIKWGSSFYDATRLYAQKLGEDGSRLWNTDVRVFNLSGGQGWYKIVSDHAGGIIIASMYADGTWNTTPKDIIAQRVNPDGDVLWSGSGISVCQAEGNQMNPSLACTQDGYSFVAWQDKRLDTHGDIYLQKIDSTGAIAWQEDGIAVCNNTNGQDYPVVVNDGAHGVIVAWVETLSGACYGIYAQRIDQNGNLLWGEDHIRICQSTIYKAPAIVSDGRGGAFIVWNDVRGSDPDIYAQRIDSSGVIQWKENGLPVTIAYGSQSDPAAIADDNGGIIVAWSDFRNNANFGDIYAQRLAGTGYALWPTNGVVVSTANGQQLYPSLASDGQGGAAFVWDDMRNGTTYDIFVQHVDKNGYPGVVTDTDDDGIPDLMEQGPQGTETGYDGNGDNIPDAQQGNVASFYSYDKQYYVTLYVPDSLKLENVKAMDNPDPDMQGVPSGAVFPCGFFGFTVTGLSAGGNTVATLIIGDNPLFDKYYKYGPTPGENAHWYDFSFDGETGARMNGDTVNLYLTDGERGDYDITANGIIVEPGGPLQTATSVYSHEKEGFYLEQNRPNPVIRSTLIVFGIPEPAMTRLEVFDITGKRVASLIHGRRPAGRQSVSFNSRDLSEGIYILKLTAGHRSMVRKMVINR